MNEPVRNHENYFGLVAPTFTALGQVELLTTRMRFCFETWASVESFESGNAAIKRLQREFVIQVAAFNDFKSSNAAVFNQIEAACLLIAGVPAEGWELDYLSIQATDKVLIVVVRNVPHADDRRTVTKIRDTYDMTIAQNLPLIARVVGLTLSFGKSHDEFLAQSHPAV